ncbi:protein naked cuticle-like [Artemia franciscana]|uniref:protein naked cuticle-like n=1 Tax=Artemia franciscana TaxID=6661 RepID=UPI0032DBBA8C
MTTHFVKWWKTKFLNGYKHMAVILPSDMELRPSDTEELINRDDCASITDSVVNSQIPYSVSSVKLNRDDTNSSLNENKIDTVTAPIKKELKFEEFECDVSVGTQENGDRQEFSFTLYDLEGRGKVTKDDVAGLVKTIYDAVGSSVKLAPSGSKTIRVKLTVSPEKSSETEKPGNVEKELNVTGSFKTPSDMPTRKKDVNILSDLREKAETEKEMNVRSPVFPMKCKNTVNEPALKRCHGDCCEVDPLLPSHGCCKAQCRIRRRYPDCGHYNRRYDEERLLNNGEERRYYAHIVEADDLDDCHSRYEPLRRHTKHAYHRRSRSHDLNNICNQERECIKPMRPAYYSRLEKPVHHLRSRSCENSEVASPRPQRHHRQPECFSEMASPHHLLRHKHRERDQARAMQQVARWLARQKICDPEAGTEADIDDDDWETVDGTKYKYTKRDSDYKLCGSFKLYEENGVFNNFRGFEEKRTKKAKSRQRSTTVPASVLNGYRTRKHEHRHVHEHIHHHYHHYNGQQTIVL